MTIFMDDNATPNGRKGGATPLFFTEKEVADALKVSVQFLRKCRADGSGPKFHKIRACVRYSLEDVHSYLESTRQQFTGNTVKGKGWSQDLRK